VFVNSKVMQAS